MLKLKRQDKTDLQSRDAPLIPARRVKRVRNKVMWRMNTRASQVKSTNWASHGSHSRIPKGIEAFFPSCEYRHVGTFLNSI